MAHSEKAESEGLFPSSCLFLAFDRWQGKRRVRESSYCRGRIVDEPAAMEGERGGLAFAVHFCAQSAETEKRPKLFFGQAPDNVTSVIGRRLIRAATKPLSSTHPNPLKICHS
jgi:hypothetical protein